MNGNRRHQILLVSLLGVLVLLGVGAAPARAGRSADSMVVPPKASAFGKSYGAWGAAWWDWLLSVPADQNPLTADVPCSSGQRGRVWMLVGSFSSEPVSRSCTVPTGTPLLLPLINASWVEAPGDTEEDWQAGVAQIDALHADVDRQSLRLTINGEPVSDLAAYEVQPTTIVYGPVAENNIFGEALPGGSRGRLYSVGYYVLIKPLPPGVYTIHAQASDSSFSQNITYVITVASR